MRKIFLYLSLLGLGACSTPTYFLTTDIDEQAKSQSIGGEVSRSSSYYYTHTSYTVDASLKELLVPVEKIEKSGFQELDEFLFLCNRGKFKGAKKILAAQKLDHREMKIYLEGLVLFLQKKYAESAKLLTPVNSSSLALQYQLLLLDNEYELQKGRNKLNKSYFIQKYQEIIDTYTLEQEYHQFINTRIKNLRYS